jgi:hypothetical protein
MEDISDRYTLFANDEENPSRNVCGFDVDDCSSSSGSPQQGIGKRLCSFRKPKKLIREDDDDDDDDESSKQTGMLMRTTPLVCLSLLLVTRSFYFLMLMLEMMEAEVHHHPIDPRSVGFTSSRVLTMTKLSLVFFVLFLVSVTVYHPMDKEFKKDTTRIMILTIVGTVVEIIGVVKLQAIVVDAVVDDNEGSSSGGIPLKSVCLYFLASIGFIVLAAILSSSLFVRNVAVLPTTRRTTGNEQQHRCWGTNHHKS